jgi:predicted MPP superfamily phosphohydrolase
VTKPIKAGLVILGMVLIGLFAYVETRQVEVTVHQIGPPGDSSEAITVIQVSDLHIRNMGRRELAVVGHLNALKSDLLVLSGDVIDDAINLPVLERFLASLEPGNKVAVLGNWEHWSGVDLSDLRALYGRHGVRLLVNEQVSYRVGKRRLAVAGLDDHTAGTPNSAVVKGLASHGEVSLVVQHSPSWFEATAALNQSHPASLCLSGHTHGGQIAPFGMAMWTPRGSGHFIAGRYELRSCPLYISRGIGTSIAPLRIGARPEIALFKL